MKVYILYLILASLLAISCSRNITGTIISNQNLKIIDYDEVSKEDEEKASSFFKNVKPILLETTRDCLIGNVGGAYIFEKYIVVFDDSPAKSVLLFDRTGKFLHRIGKKGLGPEEYVSISDFTVDEVNKLVYVLDPITATIKSYRLSGDYINTLSLNKGCFTRHIQYAFGALYIDANLKTDDQVLLYKIDPKSGEELDSWLNADTYNKGWMETLSLGGSTFSSRNTTFPKYVGTFMDTVMTITGDGLLPFMTLKNDRWVKTPELQEAYEKSGINAFQTIMEGDRLFGINGLIECGDFTIFWLCDGKKQVNVYHSGSRTKVFNRLVDDLLYKGDQFPINNIICSDSKGVYAISSPQDFASFSGKNVGDILNSNVEKYDELSKLSEDANPVIFYYELND